MAQWCSALPPTCAPRHGFGELERGQRIPGCEPLLGVLDPFGLESTHAPGTPLHRSMVTINLTAAGGREPCKAIQAGGAAPHGSFGSVNASVRRCAGIPVRVSGSLLRCQGRPGFKDLQF
jgi:hypothetical protein